MERSEIRTRVEKVVGQVLKVAPKEITPKVNFAFDLGADSMQSIELVAALEEEFSIQMDEVKAREVQTVEAAIEFIDGYVN